MTLLIVFAVIGFFVVLCLLGVIGKILGVIFQLFFSIVGEGCGNCLGCLIWIIGIIIVFCVCL